METSIQIALQNLRKNFNFSHPKFNIDLNHTSTKMITDTRIILAQLAHEYGHAILSGKVNSIDSILWDTYFDRYMIERFYFSSKLKPKLKSNLYLIELSKYLKGGVII